MNPPALPLASALLAAALLCNARPALAQRDSATVVAGSEYAASPNRLWLLGRSYRDLWTVPVQVPVLQLRSFAGGLAPVRRGGGNQTRSLRFRGADGREYSFRSLNKELSGALPADARETLVDDLLQDQISSLHPGAALVAAPLLEAAGVLHAPPTLVVLPDDPALGSFREEFAGMLGTVAVHPNEAEDESPDFAGAIEVDGTEDVLEELEENPNHRVDQRAFLRARLMDVFFGDWDRHEDQWRWARFDKGDQHLWKPVPEDHDYVFVDYDGALVGAARRRVPKAVRFDERIEDLSGLLINSWPLDRRLLSELERPAWDSVAADLHARLTDSVIERAVRQLPAAWYERSGARVAKTLRARRERLPEVARRFYAEVSQVVEVWGTDEPERARVEQRPDGTVEVTLRTAEDGDQSPYFRRVLRPEETGEVQLYLRGGDDRATVRGPAGRIRVRILGGGGDDVLTDSTSAGDTRAALYDDRGDNRFVTRPGTGVSRRPYQAPEWQRGGFGTPPRAWGQSFAAFAPYAAWGSNVGLVVGGGPVLTRYGFRRDPYAVRVGARAEWAPALGHFALQTEGDVRREGSDARFGFLARASGIEVIRFHGFGNDTPPGEDDDRFEIRHDLLLLRAAWEESFGAAGRFSAGPVLKLWNPSVPEGSPLDLTRPLGYDGFNEVGAEMSTEWDARDAASFPHHGFRVAASGAAFPPVGDAEEAFGKLRLDGSAYLTPPATDRVTLALRAGAERALGRFPFQEAAFLGGSRTLRGYPTQRFAGEAAVWSGAELRTRLTRAKLLVRGDLGALFSADAGRVFADGDDSDDWHGAAGAGVWFSTLGRTVVVGYARGEEHRFYLHLGSPF